LLEEQPSEQLIPPPNEKGYSALLWQAKASRDDDHIIRAEVTSIGMELETVKVRWALDETRSFRRMASYPGWDDPPQFHPRPGRGE
jgi:hypothetical protein